VEQDAKIEYYSLSTWIQFLRRQQDRYLKWLLPQTPALQEAAMSSEK
jgi:hypothetical protein